MLVCSMVVLRFRPIIIVLFMYVYYILSFNSFSFINSNNKLKSCKNIIRSKRYFPWSSTNG